MWAAQTGHRRLLVHSGTHIVAHGVHNDAVSGAHHDRGIGRAKVSSRVDIAVRGDSVIMRNANRPELWSAGRMQNGGYGTRVAGPTALGHPSRCSARA